MKTVTITTYRELFELWSTNKSFQSKYPYLPLLRAEFMGKLKLSDTPSNIEHYLHSVLNDVLDEEEVEKYLFPYYDQYLVQSSMINITNAFQRIYTLKSLMQYILYKKLPVFGTISWFLETILIDYTSSQLKELFNYLPKTEQNDKPYDIVIKNINYLMKMFKVTRLAIYKPTASEILGYIKGSLDKLDKKLKYIKKYDCEWPDSNDQVYNFIKSKNGDCDTCDVIIFLAYMSNGNMWEKGMCTKREYNKYFIEGCKRYNIDINSVADNGSYLIHYAAQQYKEKPSWMKELLDNGAKMLDSKRNLLGGENGNSIYHFCSDDSMYDFLLDYFKDNGEIYSRLRQKNTKVTQEEKEVKIMIDEEEPTIDPSIKAHLDAIQEPTIRDKMTAYYIKLLVDKQ